MDTRFLAARHKYIENQFRQLNEEQRRAVLTTEGPLLLLAASGMQRGLSELHRPPSGQSCFWGSAGIVAVLMLSAAVLTVLCCVLQLWFLPGLLGRA